MGDENKEPAVKTEVKDGKFKVEAEKQIHIGKAKIPIKIEGSINKEGGVEVSGSAPGVSGSYEKKPDGSTTTSTKTGTLSKTIEKDKDGNEKITQVETWGSPDKLGGTRHTTITENGVLTEKTDEILGVKGNVGHKTHTKFYPDGKPKEITEETFAGTVVTNKKHTQYDEYGTPTTRTSEFKADAKVAEYSRSTDTEGNTTDKISGAPPQVTDGKFYAQRIKSADGDTKYGVGAEADNGNKIEVNKTNNGYSSSTTIKGKTVESSNSTLQRTGEDAINNAGILIANTKTAQTIGGVIKDTHQVMTRQAQKAQIECAEGNTAFCPPEQKPEAPPPEPSDGIGNNRPKNLTDRERLTSNNPNDKTSVNHFPKGKNGDPVAVAENLPDKAFDSLNKNGDYTDRNALATDVNHIMDLREAVHGAKHGQNTKAYHNAMQGDQQRLTHALTSGNPQLFTKLQNLALHEHKQAFSNTPAINLDYSGGQRSAQSLEELSQNAPSGSNQSKVHPSLLQDQKAYTHCREFEKAVVDHVQQHNPAALKEVKQHLADGFKTGEIYGLALKGYQNGQLNEQVLGDYARPSNIQGAKETQADQAKVTQPTQANQPEQFAQNTNAPSVGGQARGGTSSQPETERPKELRPVAEDKKELHANLSPEKLAMIARASELINRLYEVDKQGEAEKAEKIKLIQANREKGLPDDTPASQSAEVASKENTKDAANKEDKSSPQQAKNEPTFNGQGKEAGAQDAPQVADNKAANQADNPNAAFERALAKGQETTQRDQALNPQQGKALTLS